MVLNYPLFYILDNMLKVECYRAAEALNSMDREITDPVKGDLTLLKENLVSREEKMLEMRDFSKYLLGKSYFDCKEYDRAAFVLTGCKSLKSKFLRLYSKFLVTYPLKSDCCSLILIVGW